MSSSVEPISYSLTLLPAELQWEVLQCCPASLQAVLSSVCHLWWRLLQPGRSRPPEFLRDSDQPHHPLPISYGKNQKRIILTPLESSACWAARRGRVRLLRWWKSQQELVFLNSPPPSVARKLCKAAAEGNKLKALRYLRGTLALPWNEEVCWTAAQNGFLPILRYSLRHECPRVKGEQTFRIACESGHLKLVKYLHRKGCHWNEWCVWEAASHGQLEVLQYLQAHGCPWHDGAAWPATAGGHFAVIQWLWENHLSLFDEDICQAAAWGGHLSLLEFLHHPIGVPWNEESCHRAAACGHLEVLKFLHSHGCPWNANTFREAAWGRSLDVIKFLFENGCPWNEETGHTAIERASLELVIFLHQHGCPGFVGQRPLKIAHKRNDEDILKYVTQHQIFSVRAP